VRDELASWSRVGGHGLQFYATDEEIADWLLEMLPPSFAPYSILGQEFRSDRWETFEHPVEDVLESFKQHQTENHWLRSSVLSPDLRTDDLKRPEDVVRLSFGGLILIQPGREREGRRWESRISIVDRIRHVTTGRELRHTEYLRIFERLRRSMRKRLVVETAYTSPDGDVGEDWPMTARAADAHARGDVSFAAEPVRRRK
jgi:hypothetical protein